VNDATGNRIADQLARYGLTSDEVLDLAGAVAAANFQRDGERIEDPGAARALFEPFLAGRRDELFAVAFLDTRHRLIKTEVLFRGTIDGATVYPRVVAERALRYGAAAVIAAHNHPSGCADPSPADLAITDRLQEALALLDIRVLDHLVIGDGACCSVLEFGKLWLAASKPRAPRKRRSSSAKAAKSATRDPVGAAP
jgi:DNA repair protein RadC